VGAVAALSMLALAAMATIASPDRQVQQSAGERQLIPPLPPPRRPLPIPFNLPAEPRPAVPPSASQPLASAPAAISGTWTPLNDQPFTHTPTFYPNGAFLLTDGRVLVQDANLTAVGWWTLTPDNTGSYINGSWSKVASPPNCPNGYRSAGADTVYSPLYYASAVLPDGRFVMIGGEYNYDYTYVDGSGEVWSDQGAIYDPLANSWRCIAAPSAWTQIGDAQSVVLPNGKFMLAHPFDNQVAILNVNTNPPTLGSPFTPSGKSADPHFDEETWTLLPDGTVLTLEIYNANDGTETPALVYTPSLRQWSHAGIAPDPLALLKDGKTIYDEIGPAILRPDGTVFAVGATGFNDIYDVVGGWKTPCLRGLFCREPVYAADYAARGSKKRDFWTVKIARLLYHWVDPSPANRVTARLGLARGDRGHQVWMESTPGRALTPHAKVVKKFEASAPPVALGHLAHPATQPGSPQRPAASFSSPSRVVIQFAARHVIYASGFLRRR
jgi:hypothetical protein